VTRDAVVVAALRTPVGRRGGALADVHPVQLGATVLRALAERTPLDPALVEDVIWGCVTQAGEQAVNVGRSTVLAAGWPQGVPATTVDRQCGSSQQAVHFAAAGLVAGHYDIVVAGGVESMTRAPMGSAMSEGTYGEAVLSRYADELARQGASTFHQGLGAEDIATRWQLSRSELDGFAVRSHERAAAAADGGAFDEQLAPVTRPDGVTVDADEGIRRGTSIDALAALRSAFRPDGTVTAGNASQISDGAAALLMMTSERAAQLGLSPLARVHSVAVVGDDPVTMLTGPIPATAKVLARSGLTLADIGAYEVNEAFASVPLAWLAETGADAQRLNPLGGAIALGHPLGASGARIMTTLVHHLGATGTAYGLQTMCEGGGLANATILERL
jgi:acetyl-CoA acyltransferase